MQQTTIGSGDGFKMGCSNHDHTTSHESVNDRVDVSTCFADSENDLTHQLVECFGQVHEQNRCRGGLVFARVADKGGDQVMTSVRTSSFRTATLLRWEKLFNGFLDLCCKNSCAQLGGVVSNEQASVRVS